MKRKSGDTKSFAMNMANDGIYNSNSNNNNQSSNAEGVMESGRWVDRINLSGNVPFSTWIFDTSVPILAN